MPIYDVTFRVEGYAWATFEAEDLTEAEEIAHHYFTTSDMDISNLEVDSLDEQPGETPA